MLGIWILAKNSIDFKIDSIEVHNQATSFMINKNYQWTLFWEYLVDLRTRIKVSRLLGDFNDISKPSEVRGESPQ
ncbi:hypothetical protein JHK87_034838 [Glycine soja]|nr:hypothetical protein JHK87_034838 [Glycine soja]